jgi:hypothetical protein
MTDTTWTTLSLSWTAAANCTHYVVYRSTTGQAGSYTQAGDVATTSFTDQSLTPGTTYYYVVKGRYASDGVEDTTGESSSANGRTYYRFQKTFGGSSDESGNSVCVTADGSFALCGVTTSYGLGASDMYFVRTDASGGNEVTNTIGTTSADAACSIAPSHGTGFVLGGYLASPGTNTPVATIVEVDADGVEAASGQPYSAMYMSALNSVEQVAGGYAMAGYIMWPPRYMILSNTDDALDTAWSKKYGNSTLGTMTEGYAVASAGSCLVCAGYTRAAGGEMDAYLRKTTSAGADVVAATRTFSFTGDDAIYGVAYVASEGTFVMCGYTNPSGGDKQVLVMKTDANLDILWTETYGATPGDDIGYGVQLADDGYAVIVGATASGSAQATDVYLLKIDLADGTIDFEERIGGAGDDYGKSVVQTDDGGYVIVGTTTSYGAGGQDVYLIKADNLGSLTDAP